MDITSVTVGLPVSDLQRSREWYQQLLELEAASLEPVDGVIEYDLGPCWLQLYQQDGGQPGRVAVRLGVADLAAERQRLVDLGVEVGAVARVGGSFEFADLADPDGHLLSLYQMLTDDPPVS